MRSERRDVARAYIRYRYKKEVARNKKDDFIKAIREKLDGNNVKNQKIDLVNIERDDLLKIRKLLLEEVKIQDERFEDEIKSLEMLKSVS